MMLLIDDIWVTDAVLERKFVCDLTTCKGACCVAGEHGAPLEPAERAQLEEDINQIKPYLTDEGRKAIDQKGVAYEIKDGLRTTLREDAACAFVTFDKNGTAKCGIEQAYEEGVTTFRKPISCHLYPIRVQKLKEGEALNYNEWEICHGACLLGEALKVPVYRFLRDALIRKYGEEFYQALEAAVALEQGEAD